uniref:Uncharacterized protein n=1 Tax=Lepeophtheirus salmonis TaxID=72036 RepID=A0A0K2UNN2_LEPSM
MKTRPNSKAMEESTPLLKSSKWCLIRHVKTGRVLDVAPDSEFVIAYPTVHRGPNQLWKWDGSSLVSRDGFGLLRHEKEGKVIKSKSLEKSQQFTFGEDGIFITDDKLVLGFRAGNLTLETCSDNKAFEEQRWELIETDDHENYEAKPATSCHLRYDIVDPYFKNRDEWKLSCSVKVKSSTECTYFCVVGWSPGGYAGIQEIDSNNKIAIFTLWDGEELLDPAIEVKRGEGVTISEFDGEGHGLKCTKKIDWKLKEKILVTVEGKFNSGEGFWYVTCKILQRKKEYLIATLKRQKCALEIDGYYSFIEDWNRTPGAAGHNVERCALFSEPKYNDQCLEKMTFTKVVSGHDSYAKEKTKAKRTGGQVVTMLSGGKKSFPLCENGMDIELKAKSGFLCF